MEYSQRSPINVGSSKDVWIVGCHAILQLWIHFGLHIFVVYTLSLARVPSQTLEYMYMWLSLMYAITMWDFLLHKFATCLSVSQVFLSYSGTLLYIPTMKYSTSMHALHWTLTWNCHMCNIKSIQKLSGSRGPHNRYSPIALCTVASCFVHWRTLYGKDCPFSVSNEHFSGFRYRTNDFVQTWTLFRNWCPSLFVHNLYSTNPEWRQYVTTTWTWFKS